MKVDRFNRTWCSGSRMHASKKMTHSLKLGKVTKTSFLFKYSFSTSSLVFLKLSSKLILRQAAIIAFSAALSVAILSLSVAILSYAPGLLNLASVCAYSLAILAHLCKCTHHKPHWNFVICFG